MNDLNNKVEKLAQLITKETTERLRKNYQSFTHEMLIHDSMIHVKPGLKYVKVDVGASGKYMVEISTEAIYGIKGYGQIHRGHYYGTLDTIDQYYWGDYTAQRRET